MFKSFEIHANLLNAFAVAALLFSAPAIGSDGDSDLETRCGGRAVWQNAHPTFELHASIMNQEYFIKRAMTRWNEMGGTHVSISYSTANKNRTPGEWDLTSDIYSKSIKDESVLAATETLSFCDYFGQALRIVVADIYFDSDSNIVWTNEPINFFEYVRNGGDGRYRFMPVALHELGHAIGLDHYNQAMATMNSIYPMGGPTTPDQEYDPLPHERQTVRRLFPDSTSQIDVAASRFWKDPWDANVRVLPISDGITPGEKATIQFSLLNQGMVTVSVPVSVYLIDDVGFPPQNHLLRQLQIHDLKPGEARQVDASATIPSPIEMSPANRYRIFVHVNHGVGNEYNDRDGGNILFRRNNFVENRVVASGAQGPWPTCPTPEVPVCP